MGVDLAAGWAGAVIGVEIGTAIPVPVSGTFAGAAIGFIAGTVLGRPGANAVA